MVTEDQGFRHRRVVPTTPPSRRYRLRSRERQGVPALLVALPLGLPTVLMVIGYSALLQFLENNWLSPRVMSHAIGVSALVALVAARLRTLYGVVGIFIAIPLAAVLQVLLDRMVINVEPVPEAYGVTADPLAGLRELVGREMKQPGDIGQGVAFVDAIL